MEIVDGYLHFKKIRNNVHYLLNVLMPKVRHCNNASFGDKLAFLMELSAFRNQPAHHI